MTWRAHIDTGDFMRRHLNLFLIDEWPGGYTLLGPGGQILTNVTVADGVEAERAEPSLQLPEHAAPALFAALSRHLGAVEHPEQLRRDYDAERKRVDLFIEHLTATPR